MPIQAVGPTNAKVALVGEFPHEQDLLRSQPFCGGPGLELSKMLAEAGIHRESCYVTMVCNDRVPRSRIEGVMAQAKKDITPQHVLWQGEWVLPQVVEGAERLKRELLLVKPNVVCAIGNLALWTLTGQWGVQDWRSSIMESTLIPGLKVIPTQSPAILHAQWNRRPLIVHDLKRVQRQSATPAITRPNYSHVIRPSFETAINTLDNLIHRAMVAKESGEKLELGADIETRAGHIACIAFAWSELEAVCIPLMCQHNAEGYWTEEEEATLVFKMLTLMRLSKIIGQNWNYDAQYIYRHWHFICPDVEDTMIMQHSCFSNMEKNLSFLSSMYLEDHLHWKDDRTNWKEGPKGEGEDSYWRYNCTDAVRTFAIAKVLRALVKSLGMEAVNAFQQRLAGLVLDTMNRGIAFDKTARLALSFQLQEEVANRQAWLYEAIGHEINIKSPKQMQEFFYTEMGQKEVRVRRPDGTLGVTTNDEALHKISAREPLLLPITRKISELRSLGVFHSTFVQAALDIDGRIRSNLNVCGTETYRFASSKNAFGTGLNCQNIPKGGDTEDGALELPNVRKLFLPDPGYTIADIDLDSADLRTVTWESDCAWMKDHFKNKRKPYIEVMREYHKDNTMTKDSHPAEYGKFKSLCHGTNYLGTAEGIAPRIGLNVHETERIQRWYLEMCPEISKWQKDIKAQVTKRRYVENAFGYRTYFFDRIEGTIFNQAVAWIPQSTVACLINRIWEAIDRELKEVEVLLQVHDSLVMQFPSVQGDWMLRRIVEVGNTVLVPYADPLHIPVGIASSSKSWGECG